VTQNFEQFRAVQDAGISRLPQLVKPNSNLQQDWDGGPKSKYHVPDEANVAGLYEASWQKAGENEEKKQVYLEAVAQQRSGTKGLEAAAADDGGAAQNDQPTMDDYRLMKPAELMEAMKDKRLKVDDLRLKKGKPAAKDKPLMLDRLATHIEQNMNKAEALAQKLEEANVRQQLNGTTPAQLDSGSLKKELKARGMPTRSADTGGKMARLEMAQALDAALRAQYRLELAASAEAAAGAAAGSRAPQQFRDYQRTADHGLAVRGGPVREVLHLDLLATVRARDYSGARALMRNQGFDVNFAHPVTGETLMLAAAAAGDLAFVRLFLALGGSHGRADGAGRTPVDLAVLHQHREVVAALKGVWRWRGVGRGKQGGGGRAAEAAKATARACAEWREEFGRAADAQEEERRARAAAAAAAAELNLRGADWAVPG
jgi:hypothetical protein